MKERILKFIGELKLRTKIILILLILGIFCYWILTTQFGAKHFGGTYTINLEKNNKLVNVTWKDEQLWLLTKKSNKTDVSETYEFKEDSKFNVIEGKVVIQENILGGY